MERTVIGKNIKRLRQDRQLTQEQLAERAQVKQSQVSGWETGKTGLDLASALKLAVALRVPVDEVVVGLEPSYDKLSHNKELASGKADRKSLRLPDEFATLTEPDAPTNLSGAAHRDSPRERRHLPDRNVDSVLAALERTAQSLAGSVAGLDATARTLAGTLAGVTVSAATKGANDGRQNLRHSEAVPDRVRAGRGPRR